MNGARSPASRSSLHRSSRLSLGLLAPLLLGGLAWGCGDPLDGLTVVTDDPSDAPLSGLSESWQLRFDLGDGDFEAVFRESQGLGPLYIRHSCASCHVDDTRGPGTVRKMVLVLEDGVTPAEDQSALPYGHTIRSQLAAGATLAIEPPEGLEGLLVTTRLPPAVFGRGYLEAVLDSEIERAEAEQAAIEDGITGRIHRVSYRSEANPDQPFHAHAPGAAGLIGRFGLKARIATLDDFVADAYQGDMGITSPLRPPEPPNPEGLEDDLRPGLDLELEVLNRAADYVRLLRIPTREQADPRAEGLFEEARCARCHVPRMRTREDYPIPQLAGIEAPIFTDLLLHDMGDALADGVEEEEASSREWRTAPLMGLRHLRFYLHDGRAGTVESAIRMHAGPGSEANASVELFDALSAADREILITYVESL